MPRLAPVTRASFPAKGLSVINIVSVYSGMVEEHEGGGESRLRSTSKVSGSRAIYIPVQRAARTGQSPAHRPDQSAWSDTHRLRRHGNIADGSPHALHPQNPCK